MAKNVKFDICYDAYGDILDVFLGKSYATDNYDIDFNFTLRFNPRTKALVGLVILQFSRLFPNAPDAKSRQQIAEALFRLFEQLYREKALKGLKVA